MSILGFGVYQIPPEETESRRHWPPAIACSTPRRPRDEEAVSSPALWLKSITRTAHNGAASTVLPSVDFEGTFAHNRVDAAADLAPPMNRRRLTGITNEMGGQTTVLPPADLLALARVAADYVVRAAAVNGRVVVAESASTVGGGGFVSELVSVWSRGEFAVFEAGFRADEGDRAGEEGQARDLFAYAVEWTADLSSDGAGVRALVGAWGEAMTEYGPSGLVW